MLDSLFLNIQSFIVVDANRPTILLFVIVILGMAIIGISLRWSIHLLKSLMFFMVSFIATFFLFTAFPQLLVDFYLKLHLIENYHLHAAAQIGMLIMIVFINFALSSIYFLWTFTRDLIRGERLLWTQSEIRPMIHELRLRAELLESAYHKNLVEE